MAFRKVGYDGVWMFELAALDAPRRVLEQAQQARKKDRRSSSVLTICLTSRTSRRTKARRSRSSGWLHNRRSSGKIHFLQIRDGSGFIQAVMSKAAVGDEAVQAGRSSVAGDLALGHRPVRADARAPGGYEIDVDEPRGPSAKRTTSRSRRRSTASTTCSTAATSGSAAAAAGDPARAARSHQRRPRLLQRARLHPRRHADLHAGRVRRHDDAVPGAVLRGHDRLSDAERTAVQRGQRDGAWHVSTASGRRSAPRSRRRAAI